MKTSIYKSLAALSLATLALTGCSSGNADDDTAAPAPVTSSNAAPVASGEPNPATPTADPAEERKAVAKTVDQFMTKTLSANTVNAYVDLQDKRGKNITAADLDKDKALQDDVKKILKEPLSYLHSNDEVTEYNAIAFTAGIVTGFADSAKVDKDYDYTFKSSPDAVKIDAADPNKASLDIFEGATVEYNGEKGKADATQVLPLIKTPEGDWKIDIVTLVNENSGQSQLEGETTPPVNDPAATATPTATAEADNS